MYFYIYGGQKNDSCICELLLYNFLDYNGSVMLSSLNSVTMDVA